MKYQLDKRYKKQTYALTEDRIKQVAALPYDYPFDEVFDSIEDLEIIEHYMMPMINTWCDLEYIDDNFARTLTAQLSRLYNVIDEMQRDEVKCLIERGRIK